LTSTSGICLITGAQDTIARLHNSLEGIADKPGSPARKYLVSFQENQGLDSYGKAKGFNAPVGKRAAFAYSTALNHLLSSNQRLRVGDATTVFWAAQPNRMESLLYQLLGEDSDQGSLAIKELFEAPKAGAPAIYDDGTCFYVLGLSPNAARVSVRFWHVATVGELANHIQQHFKDLEIVRPQYVANPFLSLKTLLSAVAPPSAQRRNGDIDSLPPKLAGDFMHDILNGLPYPQPLLQAALTRIRAEQAKKQDNGRPAEHVTYARAALIKAWLNRYERNRNKPEKEIGMALDESCTNLGYCLGRLFAVLERIQQDAAGGPDKINTTIRDSYFGSAMSTPGAVFPTIMRRNQHHMAKLRKEKPGLAVNRDKLMQAILNEGVDCTLGFPATLSLSDQGRFVIGYYQQRQALYEKSQIQPETSEERSVQ
jgi:CRISPR-associated protein Csd1